MWISSPQDAENRVDAHSRNANGLTPSLGAITRRVKEDFSDSLRFSRVATTATAFDAT
jgi:hypothetical protein